MACTASRDELGRQASLEMEMTEATVRPDLLEASDETIDDALTHAEPMLLRGLLYLLTGDEEGAGTQVETCLLYTSPSPRDRQKSRMPSSA